jgi:hypothetical protein
MSIPDFDVEVTGGPTSSFLCDGASARSKTFETVLPTITKTFVSMSFLVGHLNDAESSSVRFSKGKSLSQTSRRKFLKHQEEDRLKLPISNSANPHPHEVALSLFFALAFCLRLFLTLPFLPSLKGYGGGHDDRGGYDRY